MKYKIQSLTDIGKFRKSNQDRLGYAENSEGCLFAIVCDGMGGHAYGEVASKLAVETFLSEFKNSKLLDKSDNQINKWLRAVVDKIVLNMKEYVEVFYNTHDMGTTLTSILFVKEKAYVLNIGDSRTYKINDHKVVQITKDQNILNDEENREKRKIDMQNFLGAKFNEMTYWKVLTSALGPNKNLKVDTYLVNKTEGYFLLTTDGVHDYIDEETLLDILESKNKLKTKAKNILEYSLNNLSTDNLSLILIEKQGD